jgi:hypothetical protein
MMLGFGGIVMKLKQVGLFLYFHFKSLWYLDVLPAL